MELGAIAMKEYSIFSKAPGLGPSPSDGLSYPGHFMEWRVYLSAEMQLVYFTAQAD